MRSTSAPRARPPWPFSGKDKIQSATIALKAYFDEFYVLAGGATLAMLVASLMKRHVQTLMSIAEIVKVLPRANGYANGYAGEALSAGRLYRGGERD